MKILQPNTIFAGRYLFIEKIGVGGFSEVWKAQDQMTEDTLVAIKIYAPERGMDDIGLKQFRREYSLVLNISHSNLLTARHFDIWEGSPYLVLPFCEKGSVYRKVVEEGPWSEREIVRLLADVAGGLAYLHENGILHQDIKPENILIGDRNQYMLTDFGISGRLRSTLRRSTNTQKALTMAYAAPELFGAQPKSTTKSDVFSLGVLIWELAVGEAPWMGAGGAVLRADSELPELPPEFSRGLNTLMHRSMSFAPEHRPEASEIRQVATQYLQTGIWRVNTSSVSQKQPVSPFSGEVNRPASRPTEIKFDQVKPRRDKMPGLEIEKENYFEMVFVKGGIFQMGSTEGESDEQPLHTVRVDDFYIGKYLVTQALWRAVMKNNPSYFSGCDNCPVERVSWYDVQAFIQNLNLSSAKRFRLPTEAEWEYAARGGQKSQGFKYAGSDNIDEVAWYWENSKSKIHPVGQKQANELGLYDMSGNVWEWCNDWYDPDYYQKSPENNPMGPVNGTSRVIRGGSWGVKPAFCRTTNRGDLTPDHRDIIVGFRLVLVP